MNILRSFQLEWLKMKHYRIFWVLYGMYLTALIVISSFGAFFLEWLKSKGADFNGIDPTILPIYDFPDIWQNIAWLAAFLKIFPAFIVIISVNNDVTYNTLRQNVIDGISKKEYLLSKFALVLFLALSGAIVLFAMGMITGSIYSHTHAIGAMFQDMEFLFAFFYQVVTYCMLAFLLSLIIKKSGFVIVALFLYTLMFEPILAGILGNVPQIKDSTAWIVDFLPAMSLFNLIDVPFARYFFWEIKDYIGIKELAIVTGWLVFYVSVTSRILVKRDLK
ncbi:MAG: hypothetical protein R8G66_12020 [Cytophagales bacterium]|nr:hypothetical protein [Cytophagales bacterium]